MTFNELTQCPFCGDEEFYTKDYVCGTSTFYQRFDGNEAMDNSEMYAGLMNREGAKCYCGNCGRYLGNRFTGKLSNAVMRKLKELQDER